MLELIIDEIGSAGDGIARKDGTTYYVPFALPGEKVAVSEKQKRGQGVETELLEVLETSPSRKKPVCRHFGTCGGCRLQHLDDDSIADWKAEQIRRLMERSGFPSLQFNPTLSSPKNSRRRVEFSAQKRKKGAMIGYQARRTNQIFDVGECPLLVPALADLVKPLRALLSELLPRNTKARLTLTDTVNGIDLLITSNFELELEQRELLSAFAMKENLCRVHWYDDKSDYLEQVLEARPTVIDVHNYTIPFPPFGFLQATDHGQQTLVKLACEEIEKGQRIIDLFSGFGTFSLPASTIANEIHAFDSDERMIDALQRGANKAMLNVKAKRQDLFRQPITTEELAKFDTIIIDPPRAGAKAQVEEISYSNVKKVVFISCNPTSFARDAEILADGGYQIGPITPVDQFNWSPHVELFTTFTKP